jgi:hypothetical protein
VRDLRRLHQGPGAAQEPHELDTQGRFSVSRQCAESRFADFRLLKNLFVGTIVGGVAYLQRGHFILIKL